MANHPFIMRLIFDTEADLRINCKQKCLAGIRKCIEKIKNKYRKKIAYKRFILSESICEYD